MCSCYFAFIILTILDTRLVQGMLKLVGVDTEGKGRVFAVGKQVKRGKQVKQGKQVNRQSFCSRKTGETGKTGEQAEFLLLENR